MKKTILGAILGIAGLLLVIGQTYPRPGGPGVHTLGGWNGGTNNIAATSTNAPGDTFAVSAYDNVGYQITVKPISTSTGTVVFSFADSLDSTTYESTPSRTVTVTLAGTGAITAVGNWTTPSSATLKLASIVSTNAMAMTNIAIAYRVNAPKRDVRSN